MTRATLTLLAAAAVCGGRAAGQETRLNVFDPSVVLFPGGRTAACDALQFTPDGNTLLAVGDDKCVHVWDVRAANLHYARPAWWNSFRERRGSMYALGLSPDGKRMVVGGLGRLTADVVVFDIASRKIVAALSPAIQPAYQKAVQSIWAAAFHPTRPLVVVGQDDGSVWVWDTAAPPATAARRVADPLSDDQGNYPPTARVSFAAFAPTGEVWFTRRTGELFTVPADGSAPPRPLFSFSGPLHQAAMTADAKTVVARSSGQRQTTGPDGKPTLYSWVEARSLPDGKLIGEVRFPATEFPDGLGLDPLGRRFGVGVKKLDAHGGETVFREGPGDLRVYALGPDGVRLEGQLGFGTDKTDAVKSSPEVVAFHPDGVRLAVAAGDHHETTLWELKGGTFRLLDTSMGVGRTIWQVRASDDGTRVSFRTDPLDRTTDPNERGVGPWRTFDLKDRVWVRGPDPQGNGPLITANGWTVEYGTGGTIFTWFVRSADGKERHPLPIDRTRDFAPVCYTFLPPKPGDPTTRLAVGHYWGYSLFELAPGQPPRRVRRGMGHNGYVSSIVPAAGGRWLVSASRDETICVWSTEPWANQPELGAKVEPNGVGESVVRAVDAGSPAWEVGLLPGDKIRKLYRAGKPVDPFDWADALDKPTPGEELAFEVWRFEGQKAPLLRKTALYQRPVWRFLPTDEGDWVLYRYQDYCYDASANGDRFLGWLLGGPSAADTPEFFPAERFRGQFRKPQEVRDFLTRYAREPAPFFRELLPPPTVRVTASADVVPKDGVTLDITVVPATAVGGRARAIDKVELWLGDDANLDHQLREWPGGKSVLKLTATVRPEELRIGKNRLVVVAHSFARGEAAADVTVPATAARAGVLRGLIVGVNTYRQLGFPDLTASVNDAALMARVLERVGQEKPFERAEVATLADAEATPKAVLAALDRAAADSAPDDWFVLFLAGHGFAQAAAGGEVEAGSWYFAGYAPAKADGYAVTAKDIFDRLKRVRCRKLILLDSCHSGAAVGADGLRDLRQDDKGPVVLTAAAPHEQAGEDDTVLTVGGRAVRQRHGFFTAAVFEGLGPKTRQADRNRDGILTVDELYEFTRAEVFRLRPDQGQTVTMAPFPLRNVGLVTVGK